MSRVWFCLLILVTLFCGLVYGSGQHILRMGANDPQIQIAQDIAAALTEGKDPEAFISHAHVDIAKSLSSYVIIYDNSQKVLASSAFLEGQIPSIPRGVLLHAKENTEERITWQPREDVRSALVVAKYKNGVVAVGRSLREVERREEDLMEEVVVAWIVMVSVVLFFAWWKTFSKLLMK